MAGKGRPKSENPLDKKVSVRFTKKEYDILLEYAKSQNMSITQAIRMCVEMNILTLQK